MVLHAHSSTVECIPTGGGSGTLLLLMNSLQLLSWLKIIHSVGLMRLYCCLMVLKRVTPGKYRRRLFAGVCRAVLILIILILDLGLGAVWRAFCWSIVDSINNLGKLVSGRIPWCLHEQGVNSTPYGIIETMEDA